MRNAKFEMRNAEKGRVSHFAFASHFCRGSEKRGTNQPLERLTSTMAQPVAINAITTLTGVHMRVRFLTLALALTLSLGGVSFADSSKGKSSLADLALSATSSDPSESAAAIQQLRSRGQQGVDALLAAYADDVSSRRQSVSMGKPDDRWQLIAAALDKVAAQQVHVRDSDS
jgi:hypothetical protein